RRDPLRPGVALRPVAPRLGRGHLAHLVDGLGRFLLRLRDALLRVSIRRASRRAAAGRDLALEFLLDALVVALALRRRELRQALRDAVLALGLRLRRRRALCLQAVDEPTLVPVLALDPAPE